MKKRLLLVGIVAVMLLMMTACSGGGLSGTYSSKYFPQAASFGSDGIEYVTFKFGGKAEIGTVSMYTGRTLYEDSKYKTKDGTITLTAEWNYTDKKEQEFTFSQSGDSIFIDGVEYSKTAG